LERKGLHRAGERHGKTAPEMRNISTHSRLDVAMVLLVLFGTAVILTNSASLFNLAPLPLPQVPGQVSSKC
jgi:hypothetical protein